jgi:outer membrane immunogenic protein
MLYIGNSPPHRFQIEVPRCSESSVHLLGLAMKKLVAALLTVALSAAGASAADLPARTYSKAPVVVAPIYNWTGFYVGLNAGYGWGRSNLDTLVVGGFGPPNQVLVSSLDTLRLSPRGFTGGGQAGYNWQSANWVFGLEADFDYFGARDSQLTASTFVGGGNFTVANSARTDWLFTARPRLGYAFNRSLIYVTGGVAVTEFKYASSLVDPVFGTSQAAATSQTKAGWTVGAGWEYALLNNWSAKVEYLYADFGSVAMTSIGGNGAVFNQKASYTTSIARAGINYKFGGPVVAKY